MKTNESSENKLRIILISATAGSLEQFERAGFFVRQAALVQEYSKYFEVEYYTCDVRNYSDMLHVKHHSLPIKINMYGLRHLLFWIYLAIKAPFMKAPIRTFGVELPTLPLIRLFSRQKVIVGFQWDYARTTRANYRGIKKWFANSLQSLGFKGADLVICTVDRLKEIAEKKYKKKAVVIPNFVDFSIFKRSHEKEDYIIYAGRLHWAKGIDFLIAAFREIRRHLPQYRLLICGTGESETSLREIVAKENIPGVEFLGSVKQGRLAEYFARAKAFVLPTVTSEGHPKALIEAMACGTACIATRVPGNVDVIADKVNGLLVNPHDANDLARALFSILHDKESRMKIEAAAYEYAQQCSMVNVLRREALLINSVGCC